MTSMLLEKKKTACKLLGDHYKEQRRKTTTSEQSWRNTLIFLKLISLAFSKTAAKEIFFKPFTYMYYHGFNLCYY